MRVCVCTLAHIGEGVGTKINLLSLLKLLFLILENSIKILVRLNCKRMKSDVHVPQRFFSCDFLFKLKFFD